MKRHRQLNKSLEMTAEVAVAGGLAPDVFEGLMGVEKAAGVEEGQAVLPRSLLHAYQSIRSGQRQILWCFLVRNIFQIYT